MCRPEFYPRRPANVALVQTHISFVLLADDDVYKLKKPVRFSFLDFSSVERRRHFCHEEVRLNRRLAPDVYRGVVAICRDGDGYRLGREDDPQAVEYAVHMRRLPAAHMLDWLLAHGQVTPSLIDALAHRIAEFHRHADTGPAVTANGDPAAVWRVLQDNYTAMRPFRDGTIAAADDDAIQAFARDFLARHDALFRRRQAEGRMRDGHGDLRCEHICCTDGYAIVDCVEFSPQFRYCDVASDIAFLAMDLEYLGHADLAAHLVTRYAAYANDPELPRLEGFYRCYRAYVRGKVGSLKSVEEEVPGAERAAARAAAQRYLALAYRYTWTPTPALVVIAGLSGTGKSAVATALHDRTGFVHINSDVVRKQLAGVAARTAPAGYEAGIYSTEMSARTYATMRTAAADYLGAGRGVILDATFQRRDDRAAAEAVAAAHGVPIFFVECRCGEDEVRRRLAQRTVRRDSPSDADWSVYLEQRRRFEPFGTDERARSLVLDTSAPLAEATRAIEGALRQRLATTADSHA